MIFLQHHFFQEWVNRVNSWDLLPCWISPIGNVKSYKTNKQYSFEDKKIIKIKSQKRKKKVGIRIGFLSLTNPRIPSELYFVICSLQPTLYQSNFLSHNSVISWQTVIVACERDYLHIFISQTTADGFTQILMALNSIYY